MFKNMLSCTELQRRTRVVAWESWVRGVSQVSLGANVNCNSVGKSWSEKRQGQRRCLTGQMVIATGKSKACRYCRRSISDIPSQERSRESVEVAVYRLVCGDQSWTITVAAMRVTLTAIESAIPVEKKYFRKQAILLQLLLQITLFR